MEVTASSQTSEVVPDLDLNIGSDSTNVELLLGNFRIGIFCPLGRKEVLPVQMADLWFTVVQ